MKSAGATVKVSAETRLSKLLDLAPAAIDYIISLNPHEFSRLRNPLMRRLMAPRITLGRVAAMVGVPVDQILDQVATRYAVAIERGPAVAAPVLSPAAAPDWVRAAGEPSRIVDLLAHDEALDADPMLPILAASKALPPGGVVLIKHKWEPQPLYDIWSKMGSLQWFAEQAPGDTWRIWVRRRP